jgi:hypothetical protein
MVVTTLQQRIAIEFNPTPTWRQSIYFDEPAGIVACLESMAVDPEAQLLRVVNKLRPGYRANAGGFRSVLVNIKLATQHARMLGLDRHVCELQLILIDFARMKVHTMYV